MAALNHEGVDLAYAFEYKRSLEGLISLFTKYTKMNEKYIDLLQKNLPIRTITSLNEKLYHLC